MPASAVPARPILLLAFGLTSSLVRSTPAPIPPGGRNADRPYGDEAAFTAEEGYAEYLAGHQDAPRPQREVALPAVRFSSADGEYAVRERCDGVDHPVLYSGEVGSITWAVEVPVTGLYNLHVAYYPVEGKSAPIERELRIDGRRPFREARSIVFQRVWRDRSRREARDNRGNDVRPMQVEQPQWRELVLSDPAGNQTRPYLLFLEKGRRTVTLRSVREPILYDTVRIYQAPAPPPYAQAQKTYAERGWTATRGVRLKVQAEQACTKSDPSLYPTFDRSSPATEPSHIYQVRLNTIGGNSWRYPGQWISWQVQVPESGLYEIVLKARQNQLRGANSCRMLYLNGVVPFAEARELEFPFDRNWRMVPLGGTETPYRFYLAAGLNTITLEVTLGGLSAAVSRLERSVLELNGLYRKIVMITGSVPDPFRDYQLERRIPRLRPTLADQRAAVSAVIADLEHRTGNRGGATTVLHRLVRQMDDMLRRPDTIADRLEAFKINIGALGAWLFDVQQLPLELDYLLVQSPGQPLPEARAGLPARLAYGAAAFIASFLVDYDTIGNTAATDEALEVWLVGGRQQAQIMKALIDERFSPQSGIGVNLRIVDEQVILPSILSGRGPDVISNLRRAYPVDLALRGGVQDLSGFPGFDSVSQRFHESALQPFRWDGGVYALAETHLFHVLFCRRDILEELGLRPPRTWEELYAIIPELQKRHLDLGIPSTPTSGADLNVQPVNPAFAMLLFQQGGELYRDGGRSSGLDSEEGIQAFRQWTDLYTHYKLPVEYPFQQSFRTGEMPLGIAYFNFYNLLTVFAPEIRGLWQCVPVPATRQADGSLHREAVSEATAAVILKSSARQRQAWQFLVWWTAADTQTAFGRDMESVLGPAARYPTANREALVRLAWPSDVLQVLREQERQVRGIPEVPGGYFTGRHIENAFRDVVFEGEDPRETLLDFVEVINEEIAIKRKEFHLAP